MARVSKITTERRAIPHEEGQWMRFNMLNWLALEEARLRRIEGIAPMARAMAGVTISTEARAEASAAAEEDPTAAFDHLTLLKYGIAEWSYEGPVDPADLDEATAKWAASEIVELASPSEKRSLGKSSSSSTGTSATPNATDPRTSS